MDVPSTPPPQPSSPQLASAAANQQSSSGSSSVRTLIIDRCKAVQSNILSPNTRKRSTNNHSGAKQNMAEPPAFTAAAAARGNGDGQQSPSSSSPAVQHAQSMPEGAPPPPSSSAKSRVLALDSKQKKINKSTSCPTAASPTCNASGGGVGGTATSKAGGGDVPGAMPAAAALKLEDQPTSSQQQYVPLLVELCVKMVQEHGLDTVGIYRIPGNTAAVNALNASFTNNQVNVEDARWREVNVVSSLLKAFFRRLPEPLLTDKFYPYFIDASRIECHQQRLRRLRHLIRKLPRHNCETLKFLVEHLKVVGANSSVNKMDVRNLALMFGPSIVRPSGDSMTTMVTHMSDQCKLIEAFVHYCDWLFSADDDLPPPDQAVNEIPDGEDARIVNPSSQMIEQAREHDFDVYKEPKSLMKNPFANVKRGVVGAYTQAANKRSAGSNDNSGLPGGVPSDFGAARRATTDKGAVSSGGAAPPVAAGSAGGNGGGSTPRGASSAKVDTTAAETPPPSASIGAVSKQQQQHSVDVVGSDYGGGPEDDGSAARGGTRSADALSTTDSPQHSATGSLAGGVDDVSFQSQQQSAVWAELRRHREQNIASARRRFMIDAAGGGGGGSDVVESSSSSLSSMALDAQATAAPPLGGVDEQQATYDDVGDGLVRHTRHLNMVGAADAAADLFSEETRERIRRMQNQGSIQQQQQMTTGASLTQTPSDTRPVDRGTDDYADLDSSGAQHDAEL